MKTRSRTMISSSKTHDNRQRSYSMHVLLLLVLIALSACGKNDCVYANEFGDRSYSTTDVGSMNLECITGCENNATCVGHKTAGEEDKYHSCVSSCIQNMDECSTAVSQWTDTGMQATSEVFVALTGSVQVCPEQPHWVSSPKNNSYYIFNDGSGSFVTSGTNTIISPQDNRWVIITKDIGGGSSPGGELRLQKSEELEVEISGSFISDEQEFTNGQHLLLEADLGNRRDPVTGDPLGITQWDLGSKGYSTSREETRRDGKDVIVHKIHVQNGPSIIRIKYNDLHDHDYTNNTEGYEIRIRSNGCIGKNGRYLEAKLGDSGPYIDMSKQSLSPWYPPANKMGDRLYFRVVDPEGTDNTAFLNNTGMYRVGIEMVSSEKIFSGVVEFIVDPVLEILYGKLNSYGERTGGAVTAIYTGTVAGIRDVVRSALVLYVILWGFGYVIGTIKTSSYEFVLRLFKMAIILQLISDSSWQFFSEHLFQIFYGSMNEFISMFTAQYGKVGGTGFEFMDVTVGIFFMDTTWKKLAALMLSGFIEFVYFICIIIAMFVVVVAFAHAILIYLMSIIAIALLLSIAPIFIAFTLFQVTRPLFDGWLKHLVSYFLQPILVLVTLILFTEIILTFIYGVLNFTACWGCKINVRIPISGSVNISFCLMEWYEIWGNSAPILDHSYDAGAAAHSSSAAFSQTTPRGLFAIIPLLMIADAMNKFTKWAVALAISITEALNSSLGDAADAMSKSTGMDRLRSRAAALPGGFAQFGINQATGGIRGAYNRRMGRALQNIGDAVGSESMKKAGAKKELRGDKQIKGNIAAQFGGGVIDGLKSGDAGKTLAGATGLLGVKRALMGENGDAGLARILGGALPNNAMNKFGNAKGLDKVSAFGGILKDGLLGPTSQDRAKTADPYAVSDSEVEAHLAKRKGGQARGNSANNPAPSEGGGGGSGSSSSPLGGTSLSNNQRLDRQGFDEDSPSRPSDLDGDSSTDFDDDDDDGDD